MGKKRRNNGSSMTPLSLPCEFGPVRTFRCDAIDCDAETGHWYGNGWLISGIRRGDIFAETDTARRMFVKLGKIRHTDLTVAYICAEHKPILAALEENELAEELERLEAEEEKRRREALEEEGTGESTAQDFNVFGGTDEGAGSLTE